jgi:hypothetical protein
LLPREAVKSRKGSVNVAVFGINVSFCSFIQDGILRRMRGMGIGRGMRGIKGGRGGNTSDGVISSIFWTDIAVSVSVESCHWFF